MTQDVLSPAGPYAGLIANLFWVFVGVAAIVYVAVVSVLVWAMRRRHADADANKPRATPRAALRAIAVAVGATAVILVALTVADFSAGRALALAPREPLRIQVTANQWWWEIEYPGATPAQRVRTANELRIPTDTPIELVLTSRDVIHSFWVPSLQGKKDLLPGYSTTLRLEAARPGVYRGECAEFCGFQHARMSIDVVAQPRADYDAWLSAQQMMAPEPADPLVLRGRDVFLTSSCIMCHAVAGTDAAAVLGPDLTHVASRSRIAAGTLPNTAPNLAAWIANPQSIKPGTRMPATTLPPQDLAALVAWLTSLR
jgi:cytochrome c oxidase subunit 2